MARKKEEKESLYSLRFKKNESVSRLVRSLDSIVGESDYAVIDGSFFPSVSSQAGSIFSDLSHDSRRRNFEPFMDYLKEFITLNGLCLHPEVYTALEETKRQERKFLQKTVERGEPIKYLELIDDINFPEPRELPDKCKSFSAQVVNILSNLRPLKSYEEGLFDLDKEVFSYAFTIALASPDKKVTLFSEHFNYAEFFDLFYSLIFSGALDLNGTMALTEKLKNVGLKIALHYSEEESFKVVRDTEDIKKGKFVEYPIKVQNPKELSDSVRCLLNEADRLRINWASNQTLFVWDGTDQLTLDNLIYFDKRGDLDGVVKIMGQSLDGITKERTEEFRKLRLDLSLVIDYLASKHGNLENINENELAKLTRKVDKVEIRLYGKKEESSKIEINKPGDSKEIFREQPKDSLDIRFETFADMMTGKCGYDVRGSWVPRKLVREAAGLDSMTDWKIIISNLGLEEKERDLLAHSGDSMMRFDKDFFKALIEGLDL